MTGLTPHRTIHRLRASGRTAVAIGAMMLMVAFLLPGLAPAAEAQSEDKCTQYYFLYTDGHTDQGEVCDGPVTELNSGTHDIHVPNLHISCSDTFATEGFDEENDVPGYDSTKGESDLGGHLIAIEGGVAQWGVRKSWTGGDDCGLVAPPPPSEPDPANPAAGLAFDCTAGLSLVASNDGDEDADLTVLQGADVIDTITVAKNTTQTAYLVDGENIAEDGSALFTVMFGTVTLVDAQRVDKSCETDVVTDPTPSVDVEKLVSLNGSAFADADTAPGLELDVQLDDPAVQVRFMVVVTNTSGDGTVLTLNSLTDQVTAGGGTALDLSSCTFPAEGLADGESVECELGPANAVEGTQHTNVVTVSATGADEKVGDSDPANYSIDRVGGEVIERPDVPAAPVDPPAGEPEPAPEVVEVLGVTEELPRTGPEDLWLAGLALMLLGAGLLTIARGKAMDATASPVGTSWTNHTA